MTTLTGLILAGGAGRRMGGQDKGWVLWQGKPLIEQVLERLRPQLDPDRPILISANRHHTAYQRLSAVQAVEVIGDDPAIRATDPEGFAGPLAGMLAGLERAATGWLLVVPCDLPQLPADLAGRLLEAALPGGKPAYAVCGDRAHPTCCLLPVSAALSLQLRTALMSGERRLLSWLQAHQAQAVDFPDPRAFININHQPQQQA
jgi:molybdopterin-guanine dinucleotide biosynthesis protein A